MELGEARGAGLGRDRGEVGPRGEVGLGAERQRPLGQDARAGAVVAGAPGSAPAARRGHELPEVRPQRRAREDGRDPEADRDHG